MCVCDCSWQPGLQEDRAGRGYASRQRANQEGRSYHRVQYWIPALADSGKEISDTPGASQLNYRQPAMDFCILWLCYSDDTWKCFTDLCILLLSVTTQWLIRVLGNVVGAFVSLIPYSILFSAFVSRFHSECCHSLFSFFHMLQFNLCNCSMGVGRVGDGSIRTPLQLKSSLVLHFWSCLFELIFDQSTVKDALQNTQNDCHQSLSDSSRVHQIPPRSLRTKRGLWQKTVFLIQVQPQPCSASPPTPT